MRSLARIFSATSFVACLFASSTAFAQTFTLDPTSSSLVAIPATSGDLVVPSGALPPSAAPPPAVALSAAALGLLPGDVVDAVTFFDDAGPIGLGGVTGYFSVDRSSPGPGVVAPPDVSGENVAFVPALTQPQAASDIFVSNDGVCLGYGVHTQLLDGDGALIGPPSVCGWGGGPPYGLGLAEPLPTPPPPFNDDLGDFDWGVPGRGRLFCIGFSLAPGSPTLTPAANALLPAGAEPGDILFSCPGAAPASTPLLFPGPTAAAIGIVSGGPGCAPPACDDIDALSNVGFSLSPASPSVPLPFSAADVISFGPALVMPAGGFGLTPGDNVDALEATAVSACPVFPGAGPDALDVDGVGACDNCPGIFNPGQEESDGDFIGDVCDLCTDTDGDGFGNMDFPNACAVDLCPFNPGANVDTDADGWADECDNCPAVANTAQTDSDFDGTGDPCDPCPHINLGLPSPFDAGTLKKLQLGYKNGVGGGDDSAKTGAAFTTGTAFDPDTTDDVHVRMTNTATGATLFSQSMTFASTFWVQPNPAKLAWKYTDAGPPSVKGQIKESPTGSTTYKWKVNVKSTSNPGPQIAPATDDIAVTLEIVPANLCLTGTLVTCTSVISKKDSCKLP